MQFKHILFRLRNLVILRVGNNIFEETIIFLFQKVKFDSLKNGLIFNMV
jgi:hypothetical protein